MYKRALSNQMFDDLRKDNGKLHRLLERVLKDDTLAMELRGDGLTADDSDVSYTEGINVYYRGGSLFYIEKKGSDYIPHFNTNYCKGSDIELSANPSLDEAVNNIPYYKGTMDFWFTAHPKYEREFQQIVVRENNGSKKISPTTDYYITDIECCYKMPNKKIARFDMIAVKWLSKGHVKKKMNAPTLSIIEMKYGDGALRDNAGIVEHLTDFKEFISSVDLEVFCKDQSDIFRQKCELGLIPDMKEKPHDINIQTTGIELMFLLANHDPDSTILKDVITSIDSNDYPFTIKFSLASMMGYGLYEDNTMTLDQFKLYLKK